MFKLVKKYLLSLTTCMLFSHYALGHDQDHYPTFVLADYVFACMAANGQTYDVLQKCSCSIDYIKQRLSYEDYEKAETIMRAQLDIGQRGIFYRETTWANERVDKLKKLQAESTLECF